MHNAKRRVLPRSHGALTDAALANKARNILPQESIDEDILWSSHEDSYQ